MKKIMLLTAALSIITLSAHPQGTGNYPHLTINSYVRDIVNHPAFKGFGERMLDYDNNNAVYDVRLSNDSSRLHYPRTAAPAVVNALNHLIDEVNSGKMIFYDFYSMEQKRRDTAKENTGLFFFKGKPGAPFAVVCPGGAWAFVNSLQAGFPIALEINKQGYNVFVIRYRIGGEQIACEDLAAALAFIFENAAGLKVDTKDYSLWGESAGARMAARLSSYGSAAYGAASCPKPVTAVIAYTAHSDWRKNDPPTFTAAGERDGIAPPRTMERRVNAMKAAGIEVEYHCYPNAPHGFGLGVATSAEGWVLNAVKFWEKHIGGNS